MGTVEEMLAQARAGLVRIDPEAAWVRLGIGALLVDVRTSEQRQTGGTVPGSRVIALNHLEWRLDPASPDRIPEAVDHDIEVIVLCDEGYCSSLAAHRLQLLGLHRATDVDGGFRAWRAAGLPITPP